VEEKNRKKNMFHYMSIKNLRKEVNSFGMEFKISTLVLCIIAVLFADGTFCYVYNLKAVCGILLAVVIVCTLPYLFLVNFRKKYHDQCFEDANQYMEQMLYSFRKHPMIPAALMDTERILKSGNLHKRLEKAIGIVGTWEDPEADRMALSVIEEEFGCDRMSSMHELMLNVKSAGGNYEESIRIMLDDKNDWRKNVDEHRMNCKKQMNNTAFAVLAVTLLGYISVYLIHQCLPEISLTDVWPYQIATTAMMLANFAIFVLAQKKTDINWLRRKKTADDAYIGRQYDRYVHFDAAKERKYGLILSLFAVPVILLSLILGLMPGVILGAVYFLYMLNIHKFKHRSNQKMLKREIEKAYPRWLTEMALLLQTDNVYTAIEKTSETAAPVLQPALKRMLAELELYPESTEPYFNFLSEFGLKDVQASMTMLYSLANGSGGDAEKQIAEIVERNNAMANKAERLANEDEIGKMYLTFVAPTAVGMLKLLVDMALFFILFFTNVTL